MRQLFKLFIALTFVSILSSGAKKSESDCQILHKGTFKYGSASNEVIVKIKGKKHTEFHNNGKYIIESKLDWVNECEYNMTMTKVTIPDFPYRSGDIMNVKIEKVIGNEIYYTSTVKGRSWNGKFIKID
jgi:hypothetical protein